VCLSGEEPIAAQDTYGTLARRLQELGGELLVRALDEWVGGIRFIEQNESGATYAEKITAEDRLLDGHRSAEELGRVVRALAPHIGAGVILADGARLGVWEATARLRRDGDPPPGELALEGPLPVLGCSPGALELTVVQPAGRRMMAADAFVRGLRT
jgi:methionyl-tRNA formyltransferase